MFSKPIFAAVAVLAALPTALGCLGYEGGLPTPTSTKKISAPIYVRAGQVFDGGWAKYDRSPTSCNGQQEGGSWAPNYVLTEIASYTNWRTTA